MAAAKPRFRQTIDFISQERIDKINNFRSTAEWKALSFSKKCLIILDSIFEQPEQKSNDALKSALERMASGERITDRELTVLAHDAEVDIGVLKKVRDCLAPRNGGKPKNVHVD